ncbi:Uncharacterised protein [Kluyvera cryocrescens]|uniref:Uncharacterized protein n=1 Tax=Kluyvera cryocrescens TaxID=580 RepID=A0A485CVW0_KLUCR|nr:Uncharacterised protein [Kluyvera cryocrescens]
MLVFSIEVALTACANRLLHSVNQLRINILGNPVINLNRLMFQFQQNIDSLLCGAGFKCSG